MFTIYLSSSVPVILIDLRHGYVVISDQNLFVLFSASVLGFVLFAHLLCWSLGHLPDASATGTSVERRRGGGREAPTGALRSASRYCPVSRLMRFLADLMRLRRFESSESESGPRDFASKVTRPSEIGVARYTILQGVGNVLKCHPRNRHFKP